MAQKKKQMGTLDMKTFGSGSLRAVIGGERGSNDCSATGSHEHQA
ncbi:hypothetical protein [Mesorhizobium liriopis]|nr:hypothetical protein [Mesorhizobium liriopis]